MYGANNKQNFSTPEFFLADFK